MNLIKNLLKPTIMFLLLFSGYIQAMNSEEVQSFLTECTGQKPSLEECKKLVKTAQLYDAIAKKTANEDRLPIYAPWRDSYKTAERMQNKSAVQKKECPFCTQFSCPQDDK